MAYFKKCCRDELTENDLLTAFPLSSMKHFSIFQPIVFDIIAHNFNV